MSDRTTIPSGACHPPATNRRAEPAGLVGAAPSQGRPGTVAAVLLRPAFAAQADPWVRWDWVVDHTDEIWENLLVHVELAGVALLVGLLIAVPVGVAAWRWRFVYPPVLAVMGVVYSIPSLALLVFLIPFTGLGSLTSQIMLVSYTLLILIRNTVSGLDSVPDDVRESATAMGYSPNRRLLRIDLPLALPAIIAGIRITAVTTIGLVTITALIGQGGLGRFIIDGFYRDFNTLKVVGTVLTVALAVVVDMGLLGVERVLTPWKRREA